MTFPHFPSFLTSITFRTFTTFSISLKIKKPPQQKIHLINSLIEPALFFYFSFTAKKLSTPDDKYSLYIKFTYIIFNILLSQ